MTARPTTPLTKATRVAVPLMVGLVLAYVLSATWASLRCPGQQACETDGRCMVSWLPWPACGTDSNSCEASEGCRKYAKCSPQAGTCVALSDADCKTSCATNGLCRL